MWKKYLVLVCLCLNVFEAKPLSENVIKTILHSAYDKDEAGNYNYRYIKTIA